MPELAEATRESVGAGACENCGYALAGVAGPACPECGAARGPGLTGLSAHYWRLQEVRHGALLVLWFLPLTALTYLLNVAVEAWFRVVGTTQDALSVFRPVSAMIFVPGVLLLAGAWLAARPLSDDKRERWAGVGLRIVGGVGAVALCLLMGHRLVGRWAGVSTTTPWIMQTLHLRVWSAWALLGMGPVFGFFLHATAAAQARAAGYRRIAYAWTLAAIGMAAAMIALMGADQLANWLWNSPPTYTRVPAPPGTGATSMAQPIPTSAGTFDSDRFYFVRIMLCAFVGMWGIVIWLSVAWLRVRLARVAVLGALTGAEGRVPHGVGSNPG